MTPARALVFDLDGTLAETSLDIAMACNHALAALGRPPRTVAEIRAFVGDGARRLVARAFALPAEGPRTDEALAVFSEYYSAHGADHVAWMPGAKEALDACAGLPLAIVTNKPRSATLPLLDALGITSRFRAIVAGGDGPLKPDPMAIHAALAPLGISPKDAWVIGDGPQDVLAGLGAGAWTVGVLGGFASLASLRDARPHRILSSLHELPALLLEAATATASTTTEARRSPSGGPSSR